MIINNYTQKIHWTYAFKCNVCGHIWTSARFTAKAPPKNCSKCKSTSWNDDVPKHLQKVQITKKTILDYLRYYESLFTGDIGSIKEHNFIVQMINDVKSQRLEKR